MIETTPDVIPVIDETRELPGFYIATGFSGHGFGIGSGVSRVLVDIVRGRASRHDLSQFRFDRFADGRFCRVWSLLHRPDPSCCPKRCDQTDWRRSGSFFRSGPMVGGPKYFGCPE